MPWKGVQGLINRVSDPVETERKTVDEKRPGIENLKPWVKGQSGNPDGRPAIPEDVKRIRKMTNDEIKEVGALLLHGKQSELEQMVDSDETPILQKWMANVALMGVKHGDEKRLNAILDRLVGKVKDVVQVELPKPTIIERHDGSTLELGSTIVKDVNE